LIRCQRGSALVLALAAIVLLTTLASALVLLVSTEARIAAAYRDGVQALHAAEAALERALLDLADAGEWDAALAAPAPDDADEPGWHVMREGALPDVVPGVPASLRIRVAIWVRDDPPAGDGIVIVRARADGAASARRTVEVTIARNGAGVRMLWWRESR
jgi:hypothetical protein